MARSGTPDFIDLDEYYDPDVDLIRLLKFP